MADAESFRDGILVAPNLVLLLPAGWLLVPGLTGDRDLGPLLAADPGWVFRVAVPGANPFLDTSSALADLTAAAAVGATPRPARTLNAVLHPSQDLE